MKNVKIFLMVCLVISGVSCKKMSYFQVNPNQPSVAPPSLELTNIEENMFSLISPSASLAERQLAYTQSADINQYYGWLQGSMNYASISQVVKMQQEAARMKEPNYIYLGKFFIDYYIIQMTMTFGDIPYSQMMQSMSGNFDSSAVHPVYDSQRDIYLGVLNDLEIANDSLSALEPIQGDIIYNGNILQWKQLINSFTLRVLMSLSKHASDTGLNIIQRFNDIVSNPNQYPLLGSNSDNGELQYYNMNGNFYPYYNDNSMKTDYYLDSSFVQMLQNLHDPRLFVYGQPTPNAVAGGLQANDFDAYGGLPGSADLSYNISKRGAGEASQINNRYAYDPVNEPSVLMSYAELEFILAEAGERGWISGNAETYYENGIQASMEFSDYNNLYSQADIQNYISQPSIALQPDSAISQIITQKYISMFMNTGWQPFYEHLRTGFPAFDVSGSGIINQANGVNAVPLRWMYPLDEYTNNAANVEAAVSRQYPNGDNINSEMWLLQ
jgi:Starch-binding associating with outer membrane